jgi:dTDP-4-dehydrorhamnose 3,5-epimerase
MSDLLIRPTALDGVWLIEPRVFVDDRGAFCEAWHRERYEAAGLPGDFVQDNVSWSRQHVLRGLHLQFPRAQGKLVYVLEGEVFDVAVDVRVGSPMFGRWIGCRLSSENRHQLYIAPGMAHGFCVLSRSALVAYKCTDYYHPESELTIAWDDPDIGIDWPTTTPILSAKDARAPRLGDLRAELPRWQS